jgi:small subunit ribosomal protein S2
MATEQLKDLVEAGVHFGHQSKKWNPRMKPFLLTVKNGIHIINLEETVKQLEAAAGFLSGLARDGKKILFVGCKRQAQDAVREAAEATGQFYVNNRWLGGTLTNHETIRKSVERLKYLENIENQPEYKQMSKKELAALGRERTKLQRNLSGIRDMGGKPDAMVVVDSHRESIAVAEGNRLGIPIVAMTDSNADPDAVTYPVASNDDAVRAIRIILQSLVDPVLGALASTGRAPRGRRE